MTEPAQSVTATHGLDSDGVSMVKDLCVSHALYYIHYLPKRPLVDIAQNSIVFRDMYFQSPSFHSATDVVS